MFDTNKEDKELEQIFSGEERELHPDTVYLTLGQPQNVITKTGTTATHREKRAQKPSENAVDAQWEPVKPVPDWMDKLKACVMNVGLFGGLSFLVFYWNEAGLMASSVAVPTMCVCTALAGWGVGKNVR